MSFKLKTIIGIGIIESILLFILIFTSINLLKTTKESELIKQAKSTATLFATTTKDAVLATDLAALDSFATEVMKNPGLLYARVLSNESGVLAEQYKQGISHQPFTPDTTIAQVTDNIFDTYAVIQELDYEYGRVELGFSVDEIDVLVSEARRKTLIIAVIELCMSALFSFILGLYLTRQLGELKQASRRITNGEYGFKVSVKGKDELAEAAVAFNRMSSNLKALWAEREQAQEELVALNEQLEQKVIERTRQLEEVQKKALEGAHRAGMADVAAGALHNIGNLMNSAKTSTTLLVQEVRQSTLEKLKKANRMLEENMDDLPSFICHDPKSKALFEYYLSIEKVLVAEQESIQGKLFNIQQSIELTSQTITEQQVYAKNPMKFETEIQIEDLFDDILALAKRRVEALNITINKKIANNIPVIRTQKNKLHQVLFNLVINAVDAIEMSSQAAGKINISTHVSDNKLYISVADNGCGIEAEMLDKIFNYGMTTKKSGNGAGLHSSANLVTEMSGDFSVKSDGKDHGATFLVELPISS